MKPSLAILKRDILALVKNPVALLVVGALLVLPGLYAWYCIVANWDPYSNTGSMPVAIVNHDRGAKSEFAGSVNVGAMVTEKLKDNDSIDWKFYESEDEALHDTRFGIVYATLVLPEDLSENLVGIFNGSSKKPTVYYYPNEKYNAVATKVTDSAAHTLVEQINQNFSSTVNQKVLQKAQDLSNAVEQRAGEVNKSALAEIREIQADLDKLIASLDDASTSIDGWRNASDGAKTALGVASEQLPAISTDLERGSTQIDSLRVQTSDFVSKLSSSILGSASTLARISAQSSSTLAQTVQDLAGIQARLEAIEQEGSSSSSVELRLAAFSLDLTTAIIRGVVEPVDTRVAEIDGRVQEMSQNISTSTSQVSNEVLPQLDSGTYSLATAFSKLSGAIKQFEPQINALQDVLAQTDSALYDAKGAIADAKALLNSVSSNLKGTITDIGAIGNALQVERLAELLDANPENVGTFISSPVNMVEEKVFPVSNYGTGVAPFYTNLALWIGCFILASLLKVEVNASGLGTTTARQRYFGRWLLFIILSLLQSQVICGVDIVLGIDCAHPALFMLAGAVCSFAYMNVIFALVKTFRNIGKTLCILLLIMQVPGSSGMYPIQMMPDFFQFIHPALPFTYGIDAMREALCGMYGMRYLGDLATLLLVVPVSLALGLLLRPLMANLLVMFDDEMNKVGFFASEEHSVGGEQNRLRGVMRVLSAHSDYADDFEERAWRFSRAYKRLTRIGKIATFAIPFAFLVLIFPFNLALNISTDTKLFVLIIMIILLLIVLFGMVVLEYMHHIINDEAKMLGASIIDDVDLSSLVQKTDPNGAPHASAAMRGGPAWEIFSTDMRLGFQSAVGVAVIMLLVITPAMYAWFNIAGSWNPYASTGNLKVAVANEDAGYKGELMPITINVGNTIVSQLRGNASFEWVFVDKDEAISGVEGSEYYAAIVIPSDFSANMMTYLVDDTEYPKVLYYTNEKENPIAPIITQKGANAIQENIRVSFTRSVDEIVLGVAYDVLSYIENPRLSDYVVKMSRHLDDAIGDGKSAARELRELAGLAKTVSSIVNAAGTTADGLLAAGNSTKSALGDAQAGLSDASSALEQAMSIARNMLDGRSIDITRLKEIVDSATSIVQTGADVVPAGIESSITRFNEIGDLSPEEAALRDALVESLQQAKQHAEAVPGKVQDAGTSLNTLIDDANAELAQSKQYFNENVLPSVNELRSIIREVTSATSGVLNGLEGTISGVGESTAGVSGQLSPLSNGLSKASEKLETSAMNIEYEKSRIAEALSSGDIKQVENVILGNDPELLAANLSAPVEQKREAIYPVANFGSAMASFYTVLSLWVGALVMISTMRVHVVEERMEELRRRYAKVRPRHEFFGRYAIFGFIGLLQSSIVLLGDLLFLHIQCVNPVMFFVIGVLIGQAFCLIVYTLTELFGDIGKALCVILLIMQVAASGGTFPIEMLDPILMNVSVFLPFYHAMCLLQECVCGIEWISIVLHSSALILMVGIMIMMGLPLRRPFRKLNNFFEAQLEKTGYM